MSSGCNRREPFGQLIARLKERHQIEIQLDDAALADAGIGKDTMVTRDLSGVTLRSTLRLLLNELDLAWVIRHEVLLITTKTEAENVVETRVYPVGDLARRDPDFMGEPDHSARTKPDFERYSVADYGQLREVVTSTVKPESWDEGTGPGPIKAIGTIRAICIPQTQEVHAEIEELLASLRAVREKQRPAARAARRNPIGPPGEDEGTLRIRVYFPNFFAAGVLVEWGLAAGCFRWAAPPEGWEATRPAVSRTRSCKHGQWKLPNSFPNSLRSTTGIRQAAKERSAPRKEGSSFFRLTTYTPKFKNS